MPTGRSRGALLKLREMRGTQTEAEATRWNEMREEFRRRQMMGGSEDPASRITGVLSGVVKELGGLSKRFSGLDVIDGRLGELVTAASVDRSSGMAKALAGVERALAEDRTGPVVAALAGIAGSLADDRSGAVAEEISALRSDLGAGPDWRRCWRSCGRSGRRWRR